MNITSFALALSVPALVAAAETPSTEPDCQNLQQQIMAQANVEANMLSLQYPAPQDKENAMAQFSYIFDLCHAANEALAQTASEIVSKESADQKAVELGARHNVYLGFCIAAAFTGLAAERLSEEDQVKLVELSQKQNQEDAKIAAEMRRLDENDCFGSDLLKQVIKYLKSDMQNVPGVKVETEPAPQD